MVGECELCLTSDLSLSDFDEEKKTISFMNRPWVDKNTEKWNSTILTIKTHIYRKRKQMTSYNQQKLDLKPGETFIHVDYSESYSNSQQDEVKQPILVSRTLVFLLLALITATVARLSANQIITLELLHSAALSPSSTN